MDPWSMKPHEHPGCHFQLNTYMRTENMLLASGRCGLVAYFLDNGRSIRWFITLTHHCKGNRSSQRSKVDIMVSGHSTSTEAIMLEDMMTRATSHYKFMTAHKIWLYMSLPATSIVLANQSCIAGDVISQVHLSQAERILAPLMKLAKLAIQI